MPVYGKGMVRIKEGVGSWAIGIGEYGNMYLSFCQDPNASYLLLPTKQILANESEQAQSQA